MYLGFFLFSLITISFLWKLMFAKVTDATVYAAALLCSPFEWFFKWFYI
jgi:hypothetical protein